MSADKRRTTGSRERVSAWLVRLGTHHPVAKLFSLAFAGQTGADEGADVGAGVGGRVGQVVAGVDVLAVPVDDAAQSGSEGVAGHAQGAGAGVLAAGVAEGVVGAASLVLVAEALARVGLLGGGAGRVLRKMGK